MHSYLSRASLGVIALASACSSTIEGAGDGKLPPGFDIAVGAEVTLTLKNAGCSHDRTSDPASRPSPQGCLQERPSSLEKVSLDSSGAFSLLDWRLERNDEVVVRVRAQKAGDGVLRIEHTDFRRQQMKEEFVLRARDITDVAETVGCQWPEAPTRRYAIAQSTLVNVTLTAMSETTPLLSGAMELVTDRGGVELLDEPGRDSRRVRVPVAPGTYTWKVAGTRSRPISFDVYDPGVVGIDLASTERGVTVRPAVNGTPVCFYEGDARASVSVVEGSCRLMVGDFEVDGAIPVTFKNGGATLAVAGAGGCTIEGAMKTGSADRLMVAPTEVVRPAVVKAGEPVGSTPIEQGGKLQPGTTCRRVSKVGNGKCEAIDAAGFVIPDGDCFSDWDWKLEHLDGTGASSAKFEGGPVGVGLLTELHVSVEFSILFIGVANYSPNNLNFGSVPPPGLELDRLGCNGSKYEALGIRAKSAGLHKLGLLADNAPGARVYDIQARDVARVSYLKEPIDIQVGTPSTSKVFINTSIPLQITYTDSSNTPLRGVAPLLVTGTDVGAEATLRSGSLYTGTRPNRITLASAVAPQVHALDVIDASAITEIGGVSPQETKQLLDERCVEPVPKANGLRVYGSAPERGRLMFLGDGCAVGGGVPWATAAQPGKVCLVHAGGPADVRVSWGPTASTTWSCGLP